MKRSDLQGLRGLAIGAVLIFHYFPKISPNGYVGVDQFFVLSGFLMMMIFGSKEITGTSCYLFYYRRIKRIVPLYLFIIFFVLILLFFAFPNLFLFVNIESGIYVIIFYTNMAKKSADNEYFIELEQAEDVFTHTWSLGVEMQFYLLAPVIFLLLRLTNQISFIIGVLYVGLLGGTSLVHHLTADSFNSFNNVFCRIWQFEVGIIAYSLSVQIHQIHNEPISFEKDTENLLRESEEMNETDAEVYALLVRYRTLPSKTPVFVGLSICLISMVTIAFVPITLPANLIRIVTTFVSGLVIVFGTIFQEGNPLGNRVLVYLGDISYAVYLIHWPVYVYVKYNYPGEYKMYCLGIAISIVLAIIISETFEKWYLTLSRNSILGLLIIFYAVIVTILSNRESMEARVDHLTGDDQIVFPFKESLLDRENMTIDEAIRLNLIFDKVEIKQQIMQNCYPRQVHDYCRFNSTELTGKLNILILGNSYAPNQGELVYETFGKFAKNMSKYSNHLCEVLNAERPKCTVSVYERYPQLTVSVKPDVLFMIARQIMMVHPISGSLDPLFLEALANLKNSWRRRTQCLFAKKYEQMVSKKIFILNAMPIVSSRHIRTLNKIIAQKINQTNDVRHNELLEKQQDYKVAQKRFEALVKYCSKCELYDFNSVLVNSNGDAQLFDPKTKLSYYGSGVHLTTAGIELVRPIYQKLSKEFETEYNNWGYDV